MMGGLMDGYMDGQSQLSDQENPQNAIQVDRFKKQRPSPDEVFGALGALC